MMILPVKLDARATAPARANDLDGGFDLFSREEKTVPAGGSAEFDTGVHMQIPGGYCGILISKSGLNRKHSITSHGLVDSGYTGSILVKLYNHGDEDYTVLAGDKISQIVITPCLAAGVVVVDNISGGTRGDNGFGSSGR